MGLMDALQDPLFWRDVRRNAKDLGQSASNAALSNVTGPVDMANSLLGLLGMKSAEPVGGSKWAERVGLSRQVNQGLPQVVGETLGLVAPFAGARAPQVANKLLEYTDNAMAPSAANQAARNQLGAIVYHGSPHKFDKFDASKIGTGEGAQAYGHGLYFAESPDVASGYKATLSGMDQLTPAGRAARYMDRANGDVQAAMRLAWADYNAAADSPPLMNAAYAAIEQLKSGKTPTPSLYKVDLPDNAIARMLDWDKPLSQQAPEVQAAMKHKPPVYSGSEYTADELLNAMMTGKELPARQQLVQPEKISPLSQALGAFREKAVSTKPPTGEQVYRALADQYGHDKAAAMMREAGIPGIRYLDGGSRGAGAGTSNYVVFPGEESLLKILERNGMAP